MSDETPNAQPALEVPSVSTGFDSAVNNSLPTQPAQTDTPKDTVMSDAPIEQAASSPAPAAYAPSPIPPRTGTPAQGSRAASAHPDPGFTMPAEAPPHGDATRRYLNTKVTGALLEGMKQLAKEKPSDPLRVLGEYLIQRSKELEGGS